jgi:hypothetical protein
MIKKKKYDGVIEAVRYAPDGKIDCVRAYERSGFVFSDWLMLDRESLLERIKNGKRFHTGRRKTFLGNDFDIVDSVRLVGEKGSEVIIAGEAKGKQDNLEGTPIF